MTLKVAPETNQNTELSLSSAAVRHSNDLVMGWSTTSSISYNYISYSLQKSLKNIKVKFNAMTTQSFFGNWIEETSIYIFTAVQFMESPRDFGIDIRDLKSPVFSQSTQGSVGLERPNGPRGELKFAGQFRSDWCTVRPTHTCCSGRDGSIVEVVGLETCSDNKIKQWTVSYLVFSFVYVEYTSYIILNIGLAIVIIIILALKWF